jgi:hypothetical protein
MAEMTAQEAAEWGKTLDFPTVWATITKMGERVDEATKSVAETTKTVKEMGERFDRMTEKYDRVASNVGGLNESMGDLIETLFFPHLGDKFDAYNYNLKRMFRRVPIYDDNSRQRSDIDILLSNTTLCMAVEVKRWLDNTEKVDEHIKRMQLIRQYPPAEVKGKKLLGAIVGAVVMPKVREYAEQKGFFVLELKGEDVHLLEPPSDFQPKEW